MKRFSLIVLLYLFFVIHNTKAQSTTEQDNKDLATLFANYHEENLRLSPLLATSIGDTRYNHLLPIEFTDSYRERLKEFYNRNLTALQKFNRETLSDNDQISYDIFKREMEINLEGLDIKDYLIPFTQFRGIPLTLAQYGSGTVVQPFKTVKDYEDWISRASVFPAWADSAIVYFRRGMAQNIVLPQQLVQKMIPQMEAFVLPDPTKSVFYGPINNMPATFADTTKKRLTDEYVKLINEQLVPAYIRLVTFLRNDYLPKARTTSGIGAVPGGDKMYSHYIRYFTTTTKSADEVYQTGLSEVKRIQKDMEKVKAQVGYKGDLKSYFEYLRTDPKFFPYKTAEEVLNDYRAIQQKVDPALKKMFNHT
ncbi:MAG: DUF885 domain-containing protein, partial [Flavisolibacter sp.]|nr:DUF885 domain-containing protein [Flavisolibacter sp.]